MNSDDLQDFIDRHSIKATILTLNEHTLTVSDAARALKVENEQIIKSLVFHIDGEPLLVINNGTARVDRKKLADYLQVGRKRVKFAAPDHAFEITGYAVGSMPPFGHQKVLRTVLDTAVVRMDVIYGGGGDMNAMMRLTPSELVKASRAELAAVST